MKYSRYLFVYSFLITMSILSGCAPQYSYKYVDQFQMFKRLDQTVLNSSSISPGTEQTLRLLFLDKKLGSDPEFAFSELEKQYKTTHDPNLMIAISELSVLKARTFERKEPKTAIALYLNASAYAHDFLIESSQLMQKTNLTPSFRFMVDIYNMSISNIAEILINRKIRITGETLSSRYQSSSYKLDIQRTGDNIWDPKQFDFLQPSNQIETRGFKNTYLTKGIGAPLVGLIEKPKEKGFGDYVPSKGLSCPLTALILFSELDTSSETQVRDATIYCYDPLAIDHIELHGITVPLEANYTTPLVVLLSKIQPQKSKLVNMFRSDEFEQFAGMYMLQPYDPDKIPVVLVHGLMSTPETWMEMFNDIYGTPELREKYQIWFFQYPTGLPIIYSASLLRNELLEIQQKYDPDHSNPKFNHMMLVGHSMGGLLSRLMVQHSGTTYWDTVCATPFESVEIDPEKKGLLENVLFFEPLPFIKRVVFVSTPHRGSPFADKWITHIGAGMIKLPKNILAVEDIFKNENIEVVDELKGKNKRKINTSLELLSPESSFMKATNLISLNDKIPYHSIIGTIVERPGPGSTDGIVPYESSHIEKAESEKLVPAPHSAHKHPYAIHEIKRILALHAGQFEKTLQDGE
jgi:triacylglycerol esterase/lipase EstA (alpha/beta hydrolase family)